MSDVGSNCVYLSDECSQDVFSFWSAEPWTVGDPVITPALSNDHEFADLLSDDVFQSPDDDTWLSDLLTAACPNSIAGYAPATVIVPSTDEVQNFNEGQDVLSPTDSGHHSIASSAVLTSSSNIVVESENQDDFLEAFEECSPGPSNLPEADVHYISDAASPETCDADEPVNICCDETADRSSDVEMKVVPNFTAERPHRIAARRAEIAFRKEDSSEYDEDDDDCDVEIVQHSHQLYLPDSSSRRGRSRAAEVNRNALNARINRQKKKAYMASLESQKACLLGENKRMKSELRSVVAERDDLIDEVKYLKSVLANDSVLAKLVQSINGPPLKLSTKYDNIGQKRQSVETDHNYGPPHKMRSTNVVKSGGAAVGAGGICLHVRENQLSVELCHRCAQMADGQCSS